MWERKAVPVPILLGSRGADHVLIEPHSRTFAGRFEADIAVRCGAWSGHFVGIFVMGELRKFGQDVTAMYEGLKCTAVLKPNEPRLQMTLNVDRKDHVSVRGFAQQSLESRTILEFEFEVNREELAAVGNALAAADRAGGGA